MADVDQISVKEAQEASEPQKNRIIDKDSTIDPHSIVDVYGKPLSYGNKDPNVIGPDDKPKIERASIRFRDDYSTVIPGDVFTCEADWIYPMAKHIAEKIIDIDLITEKIYEKIQKQLKQRSIFAILDISKIKIEDGIAKWDGFRLVCKEHPVLVIHFNLDINRQSPSIPHLTVWQAARQKYVRVMNPSGSSISREEACVITENYLKQENILV